MVEGLSVQSYPAPFYAEFPGRARKPIRRTTRWFGLVSLCISAVFGKLKFKPSLPLQRSAKKRLLQIITCAFLGTSGSWAQDQTIERSYTSKTAIAINVGIFSSIHENCTPAPLPAIRLIVAPAHGQVTVKWTRLPATNLKECLAAELPAFVAFYRSVHDYVGEDEFTLELIGNDGTVEYRRITVTVTTPSKEQGI